MKQFVIPLLYLVSLSKWTEAAKMLCVYPAPFYSHQMVQRALTEELARQGHQLVVLTTLPHQQPVANTTEIDVKEKSFALWEIGYDETSKKRKTYAIPDNVDFLNMQGEIMEPITDLQIDHPQFQALINNETEQFDLLLLEALSFKLSAIRSRFKAPILLVSSMSASSTLFNMVGAETNHFFFPDYNVKLAWNISFWEKLRSLYNLIRIKLAQKKYREAVELNIKNKFGKKASASREFKEGVSMLFLNMHRFWDNNRPTPIGSVVYMEGVHLNAQKDLPEDLKSFVDHSKDGVIVVSLGSKLKSSTLPERTLMVMIEVFAQLPYDIIWKWDGVMPNKPKNIRLEKWLPQYDLLCHPKIKALVTQGGMQSTEEAIDAGVPMIGLPVFFDQWLNTHQYKKHQIGIQLNIDSLAEQEFRDAILAVINDKKYRDNARRLSRAVADMRERSGQAAARAVKRLATHGARHLRAPLADTTLAEYYMIDLVLTALLLLLLFCCLTVYVTKRVITLVGSLKSFKTDKKMRSLSCPFLTPLIHIQKIALTPHCRNF